MMKKILEPLYLFATGFTIAHALLVFIVFRHLYDVIAYNYGDDLIWVCIFFLIPSLIGMIFYFLFRGQNLSRGFKIFCALLFYGQILFTVVAGVYNKQYWGYFFKRPTVFSEVLDVQKILKYSNVSNFDSARIKPFYLLEHRPANVESLLRFNDPYYDVQARFFLPLQNNGSRYGHSQDDFFQDSTTKVDKQNLLFIEKGIYASGIIDERFQYNDTPNKLTGAVIEFQKANSEEKFSFVYLYGAEVTNDHYPFYEFLFAMHGNEYVLRKSQRFYTDIAGIEMIGEYCKVSPVFSFLLLFVSAILSSIITLIGRLVARNKHLEGQFHK